MRSNQIKKRNACSNAHFVTSKVVFDMTQNSGGISGYDGVGGNIFGDDAAGAHDRIFTNAEIGQDRGSRADRCSLS